MKTGQYTPKVQRNVTSTGRAGTLTVGSMANAERAAQLLRLTQLRITSDRDHEDAAERQRHREVDDCVSKAVERLEVYNTVERVHCIGFDASTPTAISIGYTLGTLLFLNLIYLVFPDGQALF